jgi:hypothetical protein
MGGPPLDDDPMTIATPSNPITAARLRRARAWRRARAAAAVAAWTVLFLAVVDVSLNLAFPPPPPNVKPEKVPRYGIRAYFNYGRSTEGKLADMVRPTEAAGAPLVPIGWVEHGAATPNRMGPNRGGVPRVRVSVFGMSFSNHITRVMSEIDPTVAVAQYAGPSAPPNHTFAMYRQVRRMGPAAPPADVVVYGILASSVKGMTTLTGLTWLFESPAPYCYPRYTLDGAGQLVERWPTLRTEAEFRAALADPTKMAAFRADLSANDRFYDPFCFRGSLLDRSALVRMARRAYADHHANTLSAKIDRPQGGFDPDDPDIGPPLRAMCREFAATARADGRLPIVLLMQDQGSRDDLYQLLGPSLQQAGVPFVSTHELVPTSDRNNFIPDGHFTRAADERVARVLLAQIDAGR